MITRTTHHKIFTKVDTHLLLGKFKSEQIDLINQVVVFFNQAATASLLNPTTLSLLSAFISHCPVLSVGHPLHALHILHLSLSKPKSSPLRNPLQVSLLLSFLNRLPFVVKFLSFCKSYLNFDKATLKKHLCWHKCI